MLGSINYLYSDTKITTMDWDIVEYDYLILEESCIDNAKFVTIVTDVRKPDCISIAIFLRLFNDGDANCLPCFPINDRTYIIPNTFSRHPYVTIPFIEIELSHYQLQSSGLDSKQFEQIEITADQCHINMVGLIVGTIERLEFLSSCEDCRRIFNALKQSNLMVFL